MTIKILGTNVKLTPAIKDFIQDKLQILEKFLRPEHKVFVELEVSKKHKTGLIHRAEIDIQPTGHFADAWAEDFYAAFDLCVPKIKEQLIKKKAKKLALRRKARKSKG